MHLGIKILGPPQSQLAVGMTYPTNTGENQTQATTRLFSEFPLARCYRVFRTPTQSLPAWDSTLIEAIPDDVIIILSAKNTASDWDGWMTAKPSSRTAPTVILMHHEPDQYLTQGEASGDPSPATYASNYDDFLTEVEANANRDKFITSVIFTEFIARGAAAGVSAQDWEDAYTGVLADSRVDTIGFDVYNTGFASYRTPSHMWDVSLAYAAEYNKPLVIGEWGIERKGTDPTGTECAQVMIDQIDYLAADPLSMAVAWFYNGNDVLSDTGGVTRQPEYDALQDIITTYA